MRLEGGVGFRQLWTCRRARPGQICAINGHANPALSSAARTVLDEMRRWVFWPAANPSSPVQCRAGAKKQIIGLHQQDQRVDSWPGPA